MVADLSFISLRVVAPASRSATADADFVLLVKPQFEAGPARRRGACDPEVHAAVLAEVTAGLAEHGLVVTDVAVSPLRGADGNREFFVRADRRGPAIDPVRLTAAAQAAP